MGGIAFVIKQAILTNSRHEENFCSLLIIVYQIPSVIWQVFRAESCIAVVFAVVVAAAVAFLLRETATLRTAACEIHAIWTLAIVQAAKIPFSVADPVQPTCWIHTR